MTTLTRPNSLKLLCVMTGCCRVTAGELKAAAIKGKLEDIENPYRRGSVTSTVIATQYYYIKVAGHPAHSGARLCVRGDTLTLSKLRRDLQCGFVLTIKIYGRNYAPNLRSVFTLLWQLLANMLFAGTYEYWRI